MTTHRSMRRRGFSLIELLMAIFILSIGVISIAALLPAGIHQQRRAFDDVMAPIVAENAYSIIRSKLSQSDFGSIEEFTPWAVAGGGNYATDDLFTVFGDWSWKRPTFLFGDVDPADFFDETGAIDVFGWHVQQGSGVPTATEATSSIAASLYGVPYAFDSRLDPGSGLVPPKVVITREERWYPQGVPSGMRPANLPPERPLYAWDCMFRRFQGRVQLAVFVYRVAAPGGGDARGYTSLPNPSFPDIPPVPINLPLTANGGVNAWDAGYLSANPQVGTANDPIDGTQPCTDYDPTNDFHSWQEPGQWLLDQNNNIHRVLAAWCEDDNDPRQIELTAPIGPKAPVYVEYSVDGDPFNDVVTNVWYVPLFQRENGGQNREYRLTPIYVLVKEL